MDKEPLPSTSKQNQKESRKSHNSNSDLEKQDDRSSETSMSNTRSENSNIESHERPIAPTAPHKHGSKKTRKLKERKDRGRPAGRVAKRYRRTEVKRPVRRSKRVKDSKKRRELSISTIFTRLSSNVSIAQGCPHCGHRCCRRRFYEMRRMRTRRLRSYRKMEKLHLKCMATQTSGSECNQVGSRCMMLSPLCLNTNASLPEPVPEQPMSSGITPEMIYQALRRLTMWRQEVNTAAILDYIKRSYPVGFGEGLLAELKDKLRIAVIVGIVMQTSEDLWCLNSALQERNITKNHVTLFWKIYGDTMKPVVRKPPPQETEQKQQSNTVCRDKDVLPNLMYDYDFI